MRPAFKPRACVACLLTMQATVATAADGFELVTASGVHLTEALFALNALGQQSMSTHPVILLEPGLPGVQASHLAWDLTDEPPPQGSGQRSRGTFDARQSMLFTLTSPGTNQTTLGSSGLVTATSSWLVENGDGTPDSSGLGSFTMISAQSLRFALTQAADLRVSGRVWSGDPEAQASFVMKNVLPDGTEVPTETFSAGAGSTTDILLQLRLEPGIYQLSSTAYDHRSMNCCSTDFGGSAGWDYALELNALPVPEPTPSALLLAGVGMLALRRRRPARRTGRSLEER